MKEPMVRKCGKPVELAISAVKQSLVFLVVSKLPVSINRAIAGPGSLSTENHAVISAFVAGGPAHRNSATPRQGKFVPPPPGIVAVPVSITGPPSPHRKRSVTLSGEPPP